MYKSSLDPLEALEFAFDPLRALHAHEESCLQWPEFPYKQVTIDRVRTKAGRSDDGKELSIEEAAGALLIAAGQEARALLLIEQHRLNEAPRDSIDQAQSVFERRFQDERAAFRQAKRDFLRRETAKVASRLNTQSDRVASAHKHGGVATHRLVKRYHDGSLYDGQGVTKNDVESCHGLGTFWVPHEACRTSVGRHVRAQGMVRYIGEWKDGLMHGYGHYFWSSGESWKGNFIRNEMQGKGIYTSNDTDLDKLHTARESSGRAVVQAHNRHHSLRANERFRYFDAGQHVCWGDELAVGRRLRLFRNRAFGVWTDEVDVVIVRYDRETDRHFVRKGETEETQWLSLSDASFRLLSSRPIARLMNDSNGSSRR